MQIFIKINKNKKQLQKTKKNMVNQVNNRKSTASKKAAKTVSKKQISKKDKPQTGKVAK